MRPRIAAAPPIVRQTLLAGGSSLSSETRTFMEPRFGHDFSQVRVHTDQDAALSAQAVDATAYTVGRHIVFGPGSYEPGTPRGKRLLAHELAHVVQQRGREYPCGDLQVAECDDSAETEARMAAEGALAPAHKDAPDRYETGNSRASRFALLPLTGLRVQRQPVPGKPSQAIRDPVPGLGPARTKEIQDAINAKDFQGALDLFVNYKYMDYEIDFNLLTDGKVVFKPDLTSDAGHTKMMNWNWLENKAEPATVEIGPDAFSSVPFLYSVVMHEYQHVLWGQSFENQDREGKAQAKKMKSTGEVEASAWELLHANESGIDRLPDQAAKIWKTLNTEFWMFLSPPDQSKMQPLVLRAQRRAQQIVQGTGETLVPFKRPTTNLGIASLFRLDQGQQRRAQPGIRHGSPLASAAGPACPAQRPGARVQLIRPQRHGGFPDSDGPGTRRSPHRLPKFYCSFTIYL